MRFSTKKVGIDRPLRTRATLVWIDFLGLREKLGWFAVSNGLRR
jgi:hypothetical protein